MKEFFLSIDGQQSGPHPASEIESRVASGELSPETPCAEAGGDAWKTVGEFFPPRKKLSVRASRDVPATEKKEKAPVDDVPAPVEPASSVRVARKTQAEEAEMKAAVSDKLDPEIRKKLLLYNLADAIGVDKFSPAQAAAAIALYEANLKRGKNLKIAAAAGGFVAAFALTFGICNYVPAGTGAGGKSLRVFEKIFETPPDAELEKLQRRAEIDIRKLNELREEVADVKFRAPRGQGEPRDIFLGRVVIKDEDRDISTVAGTLDFSSLTAAVPPAVFENVRFEILKLSRSLGNVADGIKKQDELFLILCSPLWTEADLRKNIAEKLSKDYPLDESVPESQEILNALKMFRLNAIDAQLDALASRVAEIADNKSLLVRIQNKMEGKWKSRKTSTTRGKSGNDNAKTVARINARKVASERARDWAANKMPRFLEKLAAFFAENEIHYSPEARAQAWTNFKNEEFPQIQTAIEESVKTREAVGGNGEFVFRGRDARNLVVVAHVERAGDIYFVPEEAQENAESVPATLISVKNLVVTRKELKPEDVLLNERYKIVEKTKTGGVPLFASGKLLGEEIFVVRTSPEWFFVSVDKADAPAEARRATPIWLGVPAEFFAAVSVGDEVPMEKLLTFERFSRPSDSSASGRLAEIPPEKTDAVKTQQAEAEIVFPPPPEIFVPEAEKPKTPPAETENTESAETPAGNASAETDVPASAE